MAEIEYIICWHDLYPFLYQSGFFFTFLYTVHIHTYREMNKFIKILKNQSDCAKMFNLWMTMIIKVSLILIWLTTIFYI
jgi:hypothetical protein